jgi:short-subunit dehydrogenase
MVDLLEFAIEKLGKVDTLIICSGVLSVLPFEDLPIELISKIMNINAIAPIETTKIFLPELLRNSGQIIIVSSASGTIPAPTRSLYTASKHALTGFFRSLRIEVGHKIHICHVMPGSVDTPLRATALDANESLTSTTSRKAMAPSDCASKILTAASESQDEVYIPYYYKIATALSVYFPNLINHIAKKKYNYPST